MFRKLVFILCVVLTAAAVAVSAVSIWWARTVVATARTDLFVERENVKALNAYAGTVRKALDEKIQEVELLRAECERTKAQQAQSQ